jgi:hypothetical protein
MRRHIMKSWAKGFLFSVLTISLLSFGCGGGGGGSNDPQIPPDDTNANLGSLVISSGSLIFDSDVTTYNVEVDNSVASFTLTPTLANTQASVKVSNIVVESGEPFGPVNLEVGSNTFEIIVTAADGITTKTYTIVMTRLPFVEKSHNADLAGLVLSQGALSPAYNANTLDYTAEVVNDVTSLTVTPTAAGVKASISVKGSAVTSGAASASIPLSIGDNPIPIVVTAEDGTTVKTYSVTVKRLDKPSTDANLSNLTISQGTLNPSFNPSTISYSAEVPNAIASLTVTPTTAGANATITVNNVTVASGSPSKAIALSVGSNTITVATTAEDGDTTKTYTLQVTRWDYIPSNNANLSGLICSLGTLTPTFSASIITYNLALATAAPIRVIPTAAGPNAKITVNGTQVASGAFSQEIIPSSTVQSILVEVTAEDGSTIKKYTIGFTIATSWQKQDLPQGVSNTLGFHGVWGSSADDVWIAGKAGTILHWNGTTLSSVASGTTLTFYGLWGSGSNDVYAVGGDFNGSAGCIIVHWNGVQWSTVYNSNETANMGLIDVWGSSADDIWAVGVYDDINQGFIMHMNSSKQWTKQTTSTLGKTVPDFENVWGSDAAHIWFTGPQGAMWFSDGTTFQPVSSGTGSDIDDMWGISNTNAWSFCDHGAILHWNGSIWTTNTSVSGYDLLSAWGSGANDIWAVGGERVNGTAIIIHWNGSDWSTVLSGATGAYYLDGVWGSGANDIWAVGDQGTVLHYK